MRRQHSSPLSLFSFQDLITGVSGIMILMVLVMLVDIVQRKSGSVLPPKIVEQNDIDKVKLEVETLTEQYRVNASHLALTIIQTNRNELTDVVEVKQEVSQQERRLLALQSQVRELQMQLHKLVIDKTESERKRVETESIRAAFEVAIAKTAENELTIIPERGYNKTPIYLDCSGRDVKVCFPIHKKDSQTIPVEGVQGELRKLAKHFDSESNYFVLLIRPSSMSYAFTIEALLESIGFKTGRDPISESKILKFSR